MKVFFKILGIITITLIVMAYLAFLFIIPRKIDLNQYKANIQKLVSDQARMYIDFKDIKLYTTPALEAGVKINNLTIQLPDKSDFIESEKVSAKISLPNLILLTIRVSEIKIDKPTVNMDISEDGSQYKIMSIVQNIINDQKRQKELAPAKETSILTFNPAWIKVKIPNINVNNYVLKINDTQTNHYLAFTGNELFASYNNMKTFKIKTNAELSSDNSKNITAKLDIDSFIPPAAEIDEDDDPDYRADMDFINPVLTYQKYNLKTDIDSKIKIRQTKKGNIKLKGYTNIENLTMNLSGYQLPKSYFRARFKNNSVFLNTNMNIAKNQNIMLYGSVNYSKHPKIDIVVNSKRIYFKDVIVLTKALMDTLNIKNDLASLNASGFVTANAKIKTDFKKLQSNGGILIRNGNFTNKKLGLSLRDFNANILFNDKTLKIKDTFLYLNNSILRAEGEINEKSMVNISLYADKLPLPGLFAALAPIELKQNYEISSGNLFLDVKFIGELKKTISEVKTILTDFELSTKDNNLNIKDRKLDIELSSDFKTVNGTIVNDNLEIFIPETNSRIMNPKLNIIVDEENIKMSPIRLILNNSSRINIDGSILEYTGRPIINISGDGDLYANDLKQLLGKDLAIFINSKGILPLKFRLNGNDKKQNLILQTKSDKLNYITPVDIEQIKDEQSILQAKITFKGNRLNIRETGLYSKDTPTPFTSDLSSNMDGAKEVATIWGTITRLNTPRPFINQIHITIPNDLDMKLYAFPKSNLKLGGELLIFGRALSPKYRGEFGIWDLSIPELYTSMKTLSLKFIAKTLYITVEDLILNGSDIQVAGNASIEPSSVFTLNNIDISSKNIDIPKLMKVNDVAMKYAPSPSNKTTNKEIPILLKDGSINLQRISSPPVRLTNTKGDISLRENNFYLDNLRTTILNGTVDGRISVNLINMLLDIKVNGKNFDVERTFKEIMNMNDTLSGTMAFNTDLRIDGAAKNQYEQLRSIQGDINFDISDGQFGPFGRLENLILAENIRESEFFQTALGSVINSLTSIQTSHFYKLSGHIKMKDGIATLDPINSVGPVMCMNISGDMNILNNEADMKLRARLGSKVADMLGPIAAINPINLVKATPGLNVAAAKMFSIFTEAITEDEMVAIPNFVEDFNKMSTTNFQVIIAGDTTKPLSLIKSFKWLATNTDIENAEQFVATLPPADAENPNATLEEILAAQAEAERIANENIFQKSIRKIKEFFKNLKKDKNNE